MLICVQREKLEPAATGRMSVDGKPFGFTLERPWLENRSKVSCIPAGLYEVKITRSFRFGRRMMEILNVPKRAGIRIHSANVVRELEGCLAVAECRPTPDSIYESKVLALEKMVREAQARGEKVEIEIINPQEKS